MSTGNSFYDLLREQYERKNNPDTSVLKKVKVGDMFFNASVKLSHSCYSESEKEFYDILKFVEQNGICECGVNDEAVYCFQCYYCYSFISSGPSRDYGTSTNFFREMLDNLVNKYPDRHFPKFLQIQESVKRKKWLLCTYYCDLLKSSSKLTYSEKKYKDSPVFGGLIPEMDLEICLRKLNTIEECCKLGFLEQMLEKVDNRFIEDFLRQKRGINFEDIEDEYILSLASNKMDGSGVMKTKPSSIHEQEKITSSDVLNILRANALVLKKSGQTQTVKPTVESRVVQTRTVQTKSIGLQKNDEEVQNKIKEESRLQKNLERQLLEKEVENKHLRKQLMQLEKDKNNTAANNMLLQKLLLQEVSDKFMLYNTIYNNLNSQCKFMLNNIAEIGPSLTSNTGLDKMKYRLHFDVWAKNSAVVAQQVETLNDFYNQMKVDIIYSNNFVTKKWPQIPETKDDMGFVFKDLQQLIKKQLELEEKINTLPGNQTRSSAERFFHQASGGPEPTSTANNVVKGKTIAQIRHCNPWIQHTAALTNLNGSLTRTENETTSRCKKLPDKQNNLQRKHTEGEQTFFEYIWKSFPNVEEDIVTKALLEVLNKNNGNLLNIPKSIIVQQVREILSRLKKPPSRSWNRVDTDDDIDNDCPICFEALEPKSKWVLPCTHKYHKNCIKKWLRNNTVCPICREHVDIKSEFPPLGLSIGLR